MSLKRNVVANYASQLYVTLIGIVLVPLYIKYMGPEAYGLIGFFSMLQAWFTLLDLGLTPTISRETARYHGGGISTAEYFQLFRSLHLIFGAIAIVGASGLLLSSNFFALQWLSFEKLSGDDVLAAVRMMSVIVALRWLGGLYRGVIAGSELLVWLSTFNVAIATLRFVAVFGSMIVFEFSPYVFFLHQFFVAVLEVLVLFFCANRILPRKASVVGEVEWSLEPIKSMLKFSLTVALTSSIWVLVTQTDKFILSGILSLADYGIFSMAVLVAGGVIVVSTPINSAVLPRMARLHAEGSVSEVLSVYRNSTRVVSAIAGAAAFTLFFYSKELLFAWTGSCEIAENASPVMQLYAAGNGLLAMSAFPYFLQYARGDLKYHLIGNISLIVVLVPCIVYGAYHYGGVGAGWVWLGLHVIYLVFWVAYVHGKLAPGLHLRWLSVDVIGHFLPSLVLIWTLSWLPIFFDGRLMSFLQIAVVAALGVLTNRYGLKAVKFLRLKVDV